MTQLQLFIDTNNLLNRCRVYSFFFHKTLVLLYIVLSSVSMKGGGPVIGITAFPNDTLCFGDSIDLSFSSSRFPTQFQYYISGSALSGNAASTAVLLPAPGQYTVMVIGQAPDGTGWANRIITVLPSPNVSLNLPFSNVCRNDQQLLSGGSPAGGIYWGTCVAQNTFSSSCNLDSSYIFYTFIDSLGCENMDSSFIRIENCLSVSEFDNERDLIVYPNPAQGNVTIELRNDDKSGVVEIVNNLGQIIFTQIIRERSVVDVSEYPNGFYTFKWISDSKHLNKWIVIQH
jgi:hypothetical protein